MKHLLTFILALTCATSFAQSVIVKATGAGAVLATGAGSVRGVVIAAVPWQLIVVAQAGLVIMSTVAGLGQMDLAVVVDHQADMVVQEELLSGT